MEDDNKVTPQPPMYTLYATLRDSDEPILMCETTSLKNIESVLNMFDAGRHIAKFTVVKQTEDKEKEVCKEKVLKRKI